MKLVIVTATTNAARAAACIESWRKRATTSVPVFCIENGGEAAGARPYLGTVSAFRSGVDCALAESDAEVIACFHDDLEILEDGWDQRVLRLFEREPSCGLAGFGGALGLGHGLIYQIPYDPMQLARVHFRSNLVNAELHGIRSLLTERVACLDGFSQIGRRDFWYGEHTTPHHADGVAKGDTRPWTKLEDLGVVHHFYDGMLGCLAKRYGWEAWYLPVRCDHHGGQTAVGDPGYQAWAKTQTTEGDHGFWEAAHKIGYDEFRDVLPLRV